MKGASCVLISCRLVNMSDRVKDACTKADYEYENIFVLLAHSPLSSFISSILLFSFKAFFLIIPIIQPYIQIIPVILQLPVGKHSWLFNQSPSSDKLPSHSSMRFRSHAPDDPATPLSPLHKCVYTHTDIC